MSNEPNDGGVGTLIPYRNPKALIGYYMGFVALIPVLGVIFGPIAIILGILGVIYANRNPQAKGMVHAIVGIILGVIGLLCMGPLGLVLAWGAFAVK
jgi:hypothetical protein